MWLIYLEALVALFLLLFIIWWTMFHGRPRPDPSSTSPSSMDAAPADGASTDPQVPPERRGTAAGPARR
ncbi:MAG TPA: hypothetical protein VMU33_03440 [Burkholderiaceae bacterium]|nr:hypothetical protein [Burkholderiaceae bacterium]